MKKTPINPPVASAFAAYQDRLGITVKPDAKFYERVGINRKRFGQLLRGEKPLLAHEVKALASFFDIPVTDLLN